MDDENFVKSASLQSQAIHVWRLVYSRLMASIPSVLL